MAAVSEPPSVSAAYLQTPLNFRDTVYAKLDYIKANANNPDTLSVKVDGLLTNVERITNPDTLGDIQKRLDELLHHYNFNKWPPSVQDNLSKSYADCVSKLSVFGKVSAQFQAIPEYASFALGKLSVLFGAVYEEVRQKAAVIPGNLEETLLKVLQRRAIERGYKQAVEESDEKDKTGKEVVSFAPVAGGFDLVDLGPRPHASAGADPEQEIIDPFSVAAEESLPALEHIPEEDEAAAAEDAQGDIEEQEPAADVAAAEEVEEEDFDVDPAADAEADEDSDSSGSTYMGPLIGDAMRNDRVEAPSEAAESTDNEESD